MPVSTKIELDASLASGEFVDNNINPYIAGRPLCPGDPFFGREEVFRFVEIETPRHAVLLYGQRRIGKTSILLHLEQRLTRPNIPVYFDLQDCASRPLGEVLSDIARALVRKTDAKIPVPPHFDDLGKEFSNTFLPAYLNCLPPNSRIVLLLDEFDVLDEAVAGRLQASAASKALWAYLRGLLQKEKHIGFIFVIGRKAEDWSAEFLSTFKGAARIKKVSVTLSKDDAHQLITLAQRNGTLKFGNDAIEQIYNLTAGHPLMTQLICQSLCDQFLFQFQGQIAPQVSAKDINSVVQTALEGGKAIFEWIWNGFPPAERLTFSAIAEATKDQIIVERDRIIDLLERQGLRALTQNPLFRLAPEKLIDWEMLREDSGGYRFNIELMRQWVLANKPLAQVKEEYYRINGPAYHQYRLAVSHYEQGEHKEAIRALQKVLESNSGMVPARLLLGQIYHQQNRLPNAVREYEKAYQYDPHEAGRMLADALYSQARFFAENGQKDSALSCYEHILRVEHQQRKELSKQNIGQICAEMFLICLSKKDWRKAIAYYERGGNHARSLLVPDKEKVRESATMLLSFDKPDLSSKLIQIFSELDPNEEERRKLNNILESQFRIEKLYQEGMTSYKRGIWLSAIDSMSQIISIQPTYKDAISILDAAIRRIRGQHYRFTFMISSMALCFLVFGFSFGYMLSEKQRIRIPYSGPPNANNPPSPKLIPTDSSGRGPRVEPPEGSQPSPSGPKPPATLGGTSGVVREDPVPVDGTTGGPRVDSPNSGKQVASELKDSVESTKDILAKTTMRRLKNSHNCSEKRKILKEAEAQNFSKGIIAEMRLLECPIPVESPIPAAPRIAKTAPTSTLSCNEHVSALKPSSENDQQYANQLLDKANTENSRNLFMQAFEHACTVVNLQPERAWFIMGIAACGLHEPTIVTQAYNKLHDLDLRHGLALKCQNNYQIIWSSGVFVYRP